MRQCGVNIDHIWFGWLLPIEASDDKKEKKINGILCRNAGINCKCHPVLSVESVACIMSVLPVVKGSLTYQIKV